MQSNSNNSRIDSIGSSHSSNQFSGWGQTSFPSATFSSDVNSGQTSWGTSLSNMQPSSWGSQSPSLNKQQNAMSDWGSSVSGSANHWGLSNTSSSTSEEDSWGQPKRLPNAGTDGWGQPSSLSSANQSNPSNSSTQQPSQWGQPTKSSTQSPSPTSGWPSSDGSNNSSSNGSNNQQPAAANVPTSNSSSSAASSKQWGANPTTGSQNATSPSSASNQGFGSATSATVTNSSSTPTSWAGAAAKGLPKAQPKPPEPALDPIQLQIEQSINSPDGWGRVPVRQDTSWGKGPEKKKQDDSNQWQATPNNGKHSSHPSSYVVYIISSILILWPEQYYVMLSITNSN